MLGLASGCGTNSFRVIKSRGVYTTGGYSGNAALDMPQDGYVARSSFTMGQTPVAMVVGYHNCSITLEIADLSGHKTDQKNIYIGPANVATQPLTITHPGEYVVRLIVNGSEHDSFKFTVAPR